MLALILALALLILAFTSERFFTVDNLLNQARLATEVGLVALPMTYIIITGGIDLSAGSILGLCAIMLGVAWKSMGLPLELAIALTLVIGTLAGLVNGWIITRVGVPPLIATLATLALYRGLAEGISQARSVRGYPDWFFALGQRDLAGVPTQLWLLARGHPAVRRGRWPAPASAARSTPSATTRPPRASRACRSTAPS